MQEVINKYGADRIFNNAEVRKYFSDTIRSIESDTIDLTQFVDYRYADGMTSFTFNKTRFNTDFRQSNKNDPRANIVPWDFDAFKLKPIRHSSKQSLDRDIKNSFSFINIMSDLLAKNKRAKMLVFNDMIYSAPIINGLSTNKSILFTDTNAVMDVATYSKSLRDLKKSSSVDATNINTFVDPSTMHNMRLDKTFSSYDFNSKGGLENDYQIYTFLGTKIIEVIPKDTSFGSRSIKYSMNRVATDSYRSSGNTSKVNENRAYAVMFNKYAIGAVESNLKLEYENRPVTDEAEYFALFSEINAGIIFPKGIHVIETKES